MKSTYEIVKSTLIHVFKNVSIIKNQQKAILEISGWQNTREKLMIICFSPLSSWVLFSALLIFYFNPFRYVMSIAQVSFLSGFVSDILFSTDLRIILATGFLLFVFNFIFHIELMLVALLGFLISNGDLHLRNALLFLPLIILGRLVLHLKLLQNLQSEAKRIWSIICVLLFSACLMATGLTLNSFQFFSDQGVFSNNMHFLRFEFFAASAFAYYFTEFFILSIWGHFYSLKLLMDNNGQ